VKMSDIKALPVTDEWPHTPADDDFWQESIVLTWQDPEQKVGGYVRIGQTPKRGTGKLAFGVVSPKESYTRSYEDVPLGESDRLPNGFASDNFVTATFEADTSRWVAEDESCSIDLVVENLHPLFQPPQDAENGDEFHKNFDADHTESAGLVRGTVRFGENTWAISGFGYRDHSWGIRKIGEPSTRIANFYWLVGSLGKDLICGIADVILLSGKRFRQGLVIADGVLENPTLKDASFTLELDGVSLRKAEFDFWTPSLGDFHLGFEGFGNILMNLGEYYLESATPGKITRGDQVGGATICSMFNSRGGTEFPKLLLNASSTNGITTPTGYAG
jgi:hypothetical protein